MTQVKRTRRNPRKERVTELLDAHKAAKKERRKTKTVVCPGCGGEDFWFRWLKTLEDCLLVCDCGHEGNALDAGVDPLSLYNQASPITEARIK